MKKYERKARKIGALCDKKNKAYGDSFNQSPKILKILYPHGIKPRDYRYLLFVTRVIDKLFRIATAPRALGEKPAKDITGYGVLMDEDDE